MKNIILKAIFIVSLANVQYTFADSPITSTYWANKYKEIPIIANAIKRVESGNQVLISTELAFLADDKNPLAHRLSLINANGWNINGLNNAPNLLKAFLNQYKLKTEEEFLEKANSHDLIVYAYCLAMDNYFDVNKALDIAFKAFEKNTQIEKENSYALLLVFVIIKAQFLLDDMNNWCEIYQNVDAVRSLYDEGKLKKDFKEEAAKPIYEYLNLYQNSCN